MTDNPIPEMSNPYQSPSIDTGSSEGTAGSSQTVTLLRQTGPWVRFMAILGLIMSALMILGGLGGGIVAMMDGGGGVGVIIAIVYPLMGVLYGVGAYYLSLYATNIKKYVRQPSQNGLDAALESQKSFWRFLGIITAVVLSIYLVIILGACLIGGLAAMG